MAFPKGNIPWNKNKGGYKFSKYTLSDEEREHRALLASKNWKGKPRPDRRGENSNFWKGGISKQRDRIYQSVEYREWRRQVFQRDNYRCTRCGANGYIEADHIKPFSLFPELRFVVGNGRTLCKPCHRKTPTYGGRMYGKSVEQYKGIIDEIKANRR